MNKDTVTFGDHWSFNFRNDPKRLVFVLARYQFAANMACKKGSVLEMGCSDGIGASLLSEKMDQYLGVDLDEGAVESARSNFRENKFSFIYDDFMGKKYGSFDAIVSLDVVEHIHPEFQHVYFETVASNLSEEGICVIGTPNISSEKYASEASRMGHVNLFSQQRLQESLKPFFHQVLPFGMNDEVAHTGYGPMAHYIFAVGCYKK